MVKLLGLRYQIVYKKGADNKAVDALPRQPGPTQGDLATITTAVPAWFADVQKGYLDDPRAQRLLTQLSASPISASGWCYQATRPLGDNVDLQNRFSMPFTLAPLAGTLVPTPRIAESAVCSPGPGSNTTLSCSWTLARHANKRSRREFITPVYWSLYLFLLRLRK